MRIGFHYHIPVLRDGDRIWMPGYLARFVDGLATRADRLCCIQHTALPDEVERCDTLLEADNVTFVSLGPHVTIPRRISSSVSYRRILDKVLPELDVLLVRGPSPLLPLLAGGARRHDVGVALLLVGDYVKGVAGLSQPLWRKTLIRAWSIWNKVGQDRAARRCLVFVNSSELYHEYEGRVAHLVETRTTTLREQEFFWRGDTCRGRPVELISAGRFSTAKGYFDVLEAVRILVGRGFDIRWYIVGWEDPGELIIDELMTLAKHNGLEGRIVNHGFKRVGSELFGIYRRADIHVIASQEAEGFPRTIWEAMASSVPVVATRVGSIPHFLIDEHHALLVEPQEPRALADAIQTVIRDGVLRRQLIAGGFALAKENTVERRSREITDAIAEWLDEE